PAKTYPGQDKDNAIAVVQNILVANAKMADKVAYDIVKTFIEKRDELAIVHAEAKNITLENQSLKNSPIPWHPGALKYFAEQGVKMGSWRRAGRILRPHRSSLTPQVGLSDLRRSILAPAFSPRHQGRSRARGLRVGAPAAVAAMGIDADQIPVGDRVADRTCVRGQLAVRGGF